MSRNAFVPMSWITSDLNGEALRTLILISCFADNKTGECWPTNDSLCKSLGRTKRNIQKDIATLVKAGLISIQDGQGKNRRFRIESPEWFDRPGRKTGPETSSNHVENRHGSTVSKIDTVQESTMSKIDTPTMSKIDTDTMSKNDTLLIRTHPLNSPNELSEKSGSVSEESKPTGFSEDCLSALSDLGQKPEPIPAEIKRMATAVNAEAWIGQVQFQSIPMGDWRVRETLARLKSRGGNKGVNYAWKIFRDLPVEPPLPEIAGGTAPRKPPELIGAEAGLAMAKRALARGETDQAEVDRYESKVEAIKRKAGMA